jgi:hypothetical protein
MLNWILQVTEWKVVDWNDLAQKKDKRWAVVNTLMNIRVT